MKDFLSVFWRALLAVAGFFIFLFGLPYLLAYCLLGDMAAIITLCVVIITAIAGLIAAVVTFQ